MPSTVTTNKKKAAPPRRGKSTRNYYNEPPAAEPLPNAAPQDAVRAEFGRRLYAEMTRRGWNQSELAREAAKFMPDGVFARNNVSRYVRGINLPRPAQLTALAKALGVDPFDLLSERGVPMAGRESPAFEIRNIGENRVWLRVNRAVSMTTALAVMNALQAEEE